MSGNTANPILDMFSGSMAGMIGKLVEHPFDTIKVKLQSQSLVSPEFKGPLDCSVLSIRRHGFLSLYKGLSSPLVGAMIDNAILFAAFNASCNYIIDRYPSIGTFGTSVIGGGCAGFTVSFILTPIELIKCQFQVMNEGFGSIKHGTPWSAANSIFKRQGIKGLYRGFLGTCLRETFGCAAWFGTYEMLTSKFCEHKGVSKDFLSSSWIMLAGALSGAAYNTIMFPADVVKSRMQISETGTFKSNAMELLKSQGIKGVYRGFGLTVLRSLPTSAFMFWTYETVTKLNRKMYYNLVA